MCHKHLHFCSLPTTQDMLPFTGGYPIPLVLPGMSGWDSVLQNLYQNTLHLGCSTCSSALGVPQEGGTFAISIVWEGRAAAIPAHIVTYTLGGEVL